MRVTNFVFAAAIGIAGMLVARATVFPRVFDTAEVVVERNGRWAKCFVFDVTNRRLSVAIESTNNVPLRVGLFEERVADDFKSATSAEEALDILSSAEEVEAFNPSLVQGEISKYVKANVPWCFGAVASEREARMRYTVKAYTRF